MPSAFLLTNSREWELLDAAKMRETSSYWSTSRWVYHSDAAQAYQITGVYGGNNVPTGTILCNSGWRTGGPECRNVISGNFSGPLAGRYWSNQLQMYGCARTGDSGSPVYNDARAYAVAHTALYGDDNDCSRGGWFLSGYIVHIQNDLGVAVRIG